MIRKLTLSIVAVVLLSLPAQLIAGGPPRLCLPINHVTAENADACAKLLSQYLGERVSHVAMQQHGGAWYAEIQLQQDVNLKSVHTALKGSVFSVPRDKISLFGPATLQITIRTKFTDGPLRDLAAIEGVTVDKSERKGGVLLVTVNEDALVRKLDAATKEVRDESPSYDLVKEVLDGHNAELHDVFWSSSWGCRTFGCLAIPVAEAKTDKAVAAKK